MLSSGDMVKGRYRIVKKLKEGGMGIVYLAEDTLNNTPCVVKEPRFNGRNDSYNLKKLHFEADILQRVHHPAIVKYIDSHDSGTTFFLVTEYINGQNLVDHCLNRPLDEKEIEDYTLQMLDTLDYLHRRNIIHRDISPDNFMISSNTVIMIDLGTAREFYGFVNPLWTAVGKQCYTPSEQWKRGESIPQSDIYALGRTMIFMLTGTHPMCQSGTVPPMCKVSGHMKSVIAKATQENPMNRFSSASEMRQALVQKISISPVMRRPRLIINGQTHSLTRYTHVVGRGAADIEVDDPHEYISRKHARISKDAFGQYWIEDGCDGIPSANGIFVLQNGLYVKKDKWALGDGDIIALCYKGDKGPYITVQYRET